MAGLGRRAALAGLGTAAALAACSKREPSDAFFCANDPATSDPSTPLTIDVHAHVFNGSDLQVADFLKHVRARDIPGKELVAELLKELGRDFAPTAQQELDALRPIETALQNCDRAAIRAQVQDRRSDRYIAGQSQLKNALARALRRRALPSAEDAEVARQIEALPGSYADYRRMQQAPQLTARAINIAGVVDFVLRNFQYRYVNVHDYLEEYSKGKKRRIDLMIAHLVDYDWPLARGSQTPTALPEQIALMERITMLTGGRVHCYAPFDPFKHIAWKLGLAPYDPLAMVQDAVRRRGCIGVKLYPPMGFAPTLNAKLSPTLWNGSPLPNALWGQGRALDASLNELYDWCVAEQIPVMSHTGPSKLAMPAFEPLVAASYWGDVVNQGHAGLRVNFGHFGATDLVEDRGVRARLYAGLMTPRGSAGGQLYADSAYLADIIGSNPDALGEALASIMRQTAGMPRWRSASCMERTGRC